MYEAGAMLQQQIGGPVAFTLTAQQMDLLQQRRQEFRLQVRGVGRASAVLGQGLEEVMARALRRWEQTCNQQGRMISCYTRGGVEVKGTLATNIREGDVLLDKGGGEEHQTSSIASPYGDEEGLWHDSGGEAAHRS
jgi:hypothetical protein